MQSGPAADCHHWAMEELSNALSKLPESVAFGAQDLAPRGFRQGDMRRHGTPRSQKAEGRKWCPTGDSLLKRVRAASRVGHMGTGSSHNVGPLQTTVISALQAALEASMAQRLEATCTDWLSPCQLDIG
jgi:hypothetical protein